MLESIVKPARTNQFHSELEFLWGKLAEDILKHKSSKVCVIAESNLTDSDLVLERTVRLIPAPPVQINELTKTLFFKTLGTLLQIHRNHNPESTMF